MEGRTVRIVASIVMVLGVIGSFIAAGKLGAVISPIYSTSKFSFPILLICLVSVFLFVFPWFVMASILDSIDVLGGAIYRYSSKTENESHALPSPPPSPRPNLSKIANDRGDGTWYCPACGTTNASNTRICKGCGRDK